MVYESFVEVQPPQTFSPEGRLACSGGRRWGYEHSIGELLKYARRFCNMTGANSNNFASSATRFQFSISGCDVYRPYPRSVWVRLNVANTSRFSIPLALP